MIQGGKISSTVKYNSARIYPLKLGENFKQREIGKPPKD